MCGEQVTLAECSPERMPAADTGTMGQDHHQKGGKAFPGPRDNAASVDWTCPQMFMDYSSPTGTSPT